MASLDELLGKAFVNVHDGRRATLGKRLVDGIDYIQAVFFLEYQDRAELRQEPITGSKLDADWRREDDLPRKLQTDEILRVANAADQALEAFDKNEPARFWALGSMNRKAHDPGLMQVVINYLRAR